MAYQYMPKYFEPHKNPLPPSYILNVWSLMITYQELNFHQGFKSKIKQNLSIGMTLCTAVSALKTTVIISILEKLIGEYQ